MKYQHELMIKAFSVSLIIAALSSFFLVMSGDTSSDRFPYSVVFLYLAFKFFFGWAMILIAMNAILLPLAWLYGLYKGPKMSKKNRSYP